MISDPLGIIAVLLVIEGLALYAAAMPRLRWLFKFVPFMFWVYFLPMLANTAGLFEAQHNSAGKVVTPVQDAIVTYCLPACLVLLLINVDMRAILRLGAAALAVMAAGALGVMVGGPVVLLIFGHWLPPDMWKGIGALSGSWIGGSANMIAVGAGVKMSSSMYNMMVVVDTIVAYLWMAVLILLAGRQERFDRWNRSRMDMLDELRRRAAAAGPGASHPITLRHIVLMFSIAAAGCAVAIRASVEMPKMEGTIMEGMISATTWAIILASTIGLALSMTPVRRLERFGASTVGYGLLYLVLAAIGSRANLGSLAAAPVMVLAGLVWVIIHGLFLLAAGRLLRAPLALLATASQANIGGPASAPVVAEVYQPGLAPVGLLLAVLGGIVGTYLGLCCAALCRMVSRW
jgi:uncharacterized membrane protein